LIPNLFTGQPSWLVILCLLLAGSYAFVLYFREKKNEFPIYLKIILGIARFISVFFIAFLLLSPFTRSIIREKEKPLVLFAIDNSESVKMNADSSRYRDEFPEQADLIATRISGIGEVRKYIFGDKTEPVGQDGKFSGALDYDEKVTDISGTLASLDNLYENMNVGALIIATDGIYNTGANPVYQAGRHPYPIYTIALGDTSVRMDIILARVNYNRMVYLNNKFPVEMVVRASGAEGRISRLRIMLDGNVVFTQDFTIDKNDYTHSFPAILDAKKSGLQKYSVSIDPVDGELSRENNRKDIFVEVLDSKSKVLLISGAPHPDISALRQAIESNMNYEVDEVLASDFKGNADAYSMVILYQLPSRVEPAVNLLRTISEKKIPVLFVLGTQSDFARFNQFKAGVSIAAGNNSGFEEAVPLMNNGFSAFSLSEDLQAWFSDLPPLIAPLGEYQVANSARVLANQRIGSVETTRPLVLVNETLDGRTGVITGEGIWKWRMYNYSRSQNHQAFNELINKIVQYLSLKEQKKNFRVYCQNNFRENEPVIFDAEVYNENYELTNDPEVNISIKNEDEKQFPFVFNKTGNSYHLDAGIFPPGNYSYQAQATINGNIINAAGQFSVTALDLEALNTVADHNLLYRISEGSGGKMFYPADLQKLADDILDRDDIRPVTYTRKKYEDLLDKGWLLALILGLLTAEWFLRKRAGGY
jgi:hypothetical protein